MSGHEFTYQQDEFSTDDPLSDENTECTGGVLIFSYCVIGLFALGYIAFAAWLSYGLYADLATLDPSKTLESEYGYGKLAVYLKDTIGIWPTTLLLFAALMSPVPVIYFQTRKAQEPAPPLEEAAARTLHRFDDGTAKLILAGLAGVFFFSAGAIRFSLIPISVAAFLLVATPILAIALRMHQGNSCE
jgi:hypothetical protein